MNRMRIRIAERLKSAQNTCAMLTTFNEIDMSGIMNLRKTYKVNIKIMKNMMVTRFLIFIVKFRLKTIRSRLIFKDDFEKAHDSRLGFMSAFIKASAVGLQTEPAVNAVIDDVSREIIYRDFVDVSFAAATPKGLVVPVIRNVESLSLLGVSLSDFS